MSNNEVLVTQENMKSVVTDMEALRCPPVTRALQNVLFDTQKCNREKN